MAGYCGYSKSNNAIEAESYGLVVASKAAQKLGVSTDAIKTFLKPSEWHHSSSWFNRVNYYNIEEIEPEIISKMKDFTMAEKNKKTDVFYGKVEYLEWSGSRRRPKAIECSFIGEIEERGCFYYFNGMRKKIGSNGTYVTSIKEE